MIDFYSPRNKSDVPLLLLFLLLLFIVLLSSCSANWHIKQAIKKDPSILQRDTVTVRDTLVRQTISTDTLIVSKVSDTITIEKDRLRIKILRSFDTLRVDGVCIGDTIYFEKKIPIEKIVYKPKQWYERYWWVLLLIIGAAIYFKR
jgi:hypothetical protein